MSGSGQIRSSLCLSEPTVRWGLKEAWSKDRGLMDKNRITRPTRPDERAIDCDVHNHQRPGW
jgi:hypothetical protein